MELIKLWCEKIYWYKVKPIYVVKKTKSNWLKSDLLRKHLTSSHSYPWITKSDFGKIPLTHSSYIHKLSYMCFVQELSLNTAKRPLHTQPVLLRYRENLSLQDLVYKFSLNFSHLTSYMCFVWALSLITAKSFIPRRSFFAKFP